MKASIFSKLERLLYRNDVSDRPEQVISRDNDAVAGVRQLDLNILYKIKNSPYKGRLLRGVTRDNLSECRKSVVREYMVSMKGFPQSHKSQILVDYANARGWTEQTFMAGTRLKEMTVERTVPAWVVNSAFELMIENGWRPRYPYPEHSNHTQVIDDTFSQFIYYWMFYKGEFVSVEQVLESLPSGIDLDMASEWVNFFIDRLGKSDGKKLSCYLVDSKGKQYKQQKNSFNTLSNELRDLLVEYPYQELKTKGYLLNYDFNEVS